MRKATAGARALGLSRVLIPVKVYASAGGVSSVCLYLDRRASWFPVGDLVRSAFPALLPTGPPERMTGSEHGRAKLDEPGVEEARRLKREGWTYPALAARYGVCRNTVYYAVTGRTWAHVPMG